MSEVYQIIAVNPGSTSTKVAVFDNDKKRFSVNVSHPVVQLVHNLLEEDHSQRIGGTPCGPEKNRCLFRAVYRASSHDRWSV